MPKFIIREKLNTTEANQALKEQLLRSIKDNNAEGVAEKAEVMDAFLVENPAILERLNARIAAAFSATQELRHLKPPKIQYSGHQAVTEGEKTVFKRVLTSANASCETYTCSDFLYWCANNCPALTDYLNVRTVENICKEQFPVVNCKNRTFSKYNIDAQAPDVSDDYQLNAGTPSASDFVYCHKFEKPQKLGGAIKIAAEYFDCDSCLDIMEIFLIDAPIRIKNSFSQEALTFFATGTVIPAGSSDLLEVVDSHVTSLTSDTSPSSFTNILHFVAPAVFDKLYNLKDANGRYVHDRNTVNECPQDNCLYCLGGRQYVISPFIPVTGTVGNNSSTIYTVDRSTIVGRKTNIRSCMYKEGDANNCEAPTIAKQFAQIQLVVPTNLPGKMVNTVVNF